MQNQTIVITGATAGIGRQAALACAGAGANVVACGRRAELGATLLEEIRDYGGQAIFVQADVTQAQAVKALVARACEHYGSLDFAFNNAGLFQREPQLDAYDNNQWHQHLAVGLTGTYLCMKYELQAMLKTQNRVCAIINNASTVAFTGSAASGAGYTAVKHGVLGLTRQAAIEYADRGIRVNAICPGPTLSEATAPLLDADPVKRAAALSVLNPTAQLVQATDIAQTLIFLCSDAAKMINGQALSLDGGQLAKL
ncbi:MAG: SDR family oxidoreductase [Gammaproteobacteria bacterium]|nr:SDR family oxidoreductase [Gammaproteobacteria bacterium]